jgi:2-haloacid dehalogenase
LKANAKPPVPGGFFFIDAIVLTNFERQTTINHMLDFDGFQVLTFDCYGTLIDWETGIFSALRPILAAHHKTLADTAILELYSELEAAAEAGKFRPYREVLQSVVAGFGNRLGFVPTANEKESLPDSMAGWNPFPDTVHALRRLKAKYQLAVISNVDDDLFAHSAPKLEVVFDRVVTAQQARCYKPGLDIFKLALERTGASPGAILHVGQSIYHDVIPARTLGIASVWLNRPSPRPNAGAARRAEATPDLEVRDLRTLADRAF